MCNYTPKGIVRLPKCDIVILMGDLNAKVVSDNTLLRHVMARFLQFSLFFHWKQLF